MHGALREYVGSFVVPLANHRTFHSVKVPMKRHDGKTDGSAIAQHRLKAAARLQHRPRSKIMRERVCVLLLVLLSPRPASGSFTVQGHVSSSSSLDGAKGAALSGDYL